VPEKMILKFFYAVKFIIFSTQSFSSKSLAGTATRCEEGWCQFSIVQAGNIWGWLRISGFMKSGLKNGLNAAGCGTGNGVWTGNRCGYWNPDSDG